MRKKELVKLASEKYNKKNRWSVFTPSMVEGCLNSIIEVITEALSNDDKITIRGFATFDVIDYSDKKRVAWDPYNKKHIEYIPQKKIRCRFSERIKEAINKE